ncbi:hypothetical protein A6M21_16505 [Desulfotomaculum copahuensis]|uniref:Uncharacterized protein n=2 Tax=Desulfotomaculum copahuensis TaxID=1838280 RepID=A0A1B7LJR5_9FIRM|nr:hypothetical protein A6M21_16505 [Desulfotomaculum copahuensis]
MSSDHDIGKNLEFADKKPMSPYPDTGKDDTNKIHNNVVVDVVDPPTASNCQQDEEPGQTRAADGDNALTDNAPAVISELQSAVQEATGARVDVSFLQDLMTEFPVKTIREKIKLLGEMGAGIGIRNVPGLLTAALRNDYRHVPGHVQPRAAPGKKGGQAPSDPGDAERLQKKRELLKSLYLT